MAHLCNGATDRGGFTLVEMIFAVMLVAVMAGIAGPALGDAFASSRVDGAASVVEADLEFAFALASRQGAPVRITLDPAARSYTFTDRATGEVLHTRRLGSGSEFDLTGVSFSDTPLDVFPTGVAAGPLTVVLEAGGKSRTVEMTRAGLMQEPAP